MYQLSSSRHLCAPINKTLLKLLSSFAIAVTLAGCAAQMAYRDGKDFIGQGRIEDGLTKFEEASIQEPRVVEYRIAVVETKRKLVASYLDQADRLTANGNSDGAQSYYQRALLIDPNNEKARSGLNNLLSLDRHALMLKEAQDAWSNRNVSLARTKLRALLIERPDHASALALSKIIESEASSYEAEASLASAYRKPITIEFKDVPIKQVFEVISRVSGLNFLFDKEVRGDQKTSIFLRNSTIEAAIHLALLSNQLEMQVLNSNTVLIYPNTPAKLKEYQELVVKSFFLSNADAKSVANTLKTILKSRDLVIDERLNLVIVRDSPEAIRLAEKLVALHDVAEPEVMLEVEVLEVKRTRLLELGVRWPTSASFTPLASTTGGTLTVGDIRSLNRDSIGVTVSPITVNARKNDTDTKILANPRIRTRNHEKAKIMIGDRIPVITTTTTATGLISESINYLDVGLKLDVQPTIYLDNDVAINISLEVSNIVSQFQTRSGSMAYQIGTRNATTVLRLKDGENQVLAGLINDEDRRSANKVPGAGDIPLVGRLFGSTNDENQKTEIVLSITPRLVRNIQRPDAFASEFKSGTESSFRIRPDVVTTPSKSSTQTGYQHTTTSPPDVKTNPALEGTSKDEVAPQLPPGSSAQFSWGGPSEGRAGELITLQLKVNTAFPLTSLPMVVGYDPQMLQVTKVTEGPFLKKSGGKSSFASRVTNDGQIFITGTRAGDGGADAYGDFATVTFRALQPSESSVQVISASATGLAGKSVPIDLPPPHTVRIAGE